MEIKNIVVWFFVTAPFSSIAQTLGTSQGNTVEISSVSGNTINVFKSKNWLYRAQNGNDWFSARLHDAISVDASFQTPHSNTKTWWERDPYFNIQTWGNDGDTYLTIKQGSVGVGTDSPQSILHIVGPGSSVDGGNANLYNSKGLIIESRTGGRSTVLGAEIEFVIPATTDGSSVWGQGRIVTVAGNALNGDATGKMILGTRRLFNKKGTGQEWFYGDDIVIDGLGNIGLGTLTPKEKLSVNGKIRAQEIKVETANWPDYVFAKDYKLESLEETERHIKEKGHLPEIPSAEEVKTNGVDLGEMNAKLLKKIEELTLYLIEFKKENDEQKKDILYLKNKIK